MSLLFHAENSIFGFGYTHLLEVFLKIISTVLKGRDVEPHDREHSINVWETDENESLVRRVLSIFLCTLIFPFLARLLTTFCS